MSMDVMAAVWKRSTHKGSNLLVLLAIADWANGDGGGAYPGTETLAAKVRMDESSVRRIIGALERSGELQVQRRASRFRTNLYTIILDNLGVPLEQQTVHLARSDSDDRPRTGERSRPRISDDRPRTGERSRPRTATRGNTSVEPSVIEPSVDTAIAALKSSDSAAAIDTNVPTAYEPTETQREVLAAWGWSPARVALEVDSFLGYWRGQPAKKRPTDYQRAFTNWLKRADPHAARGDRLARRDGEQARPWAAGPGPGDFGGGRLGQPNPQPERAQYDHDTWRVLMERHGTHTADEYKRGRLSPADARRLIGAGEGDAIDG